MKTHDLDVPRIGYIHSWTRTQDEGWWRAALDTFGVPYTYFADQKLREGNLRAKYDVLIFPHVGGSAVSQVNGMAEDRQARRCRTRRPTRRRTSASSTQSDDIRGGMGVEGLAELAKFVQRGRHADHRRIDGDDLPGVRHHDRRHRRGAGAAVRARLDPARQDRRHRRARSPTATTGADLPVYFNQSPVLNAGGGGFGGFGGVRGGAPGNPNAGLGQNVTPNAAPLRIQPFEAGRRRRRQPARGRASGGRRRRADRAQMAQQFGVAIDDTRPRVVMQFAPNPNDMLLSGTLANGQFLANRAAALDAPLGKGHVVMFAIRPFWRWQTQGTYTLGFNAIMNWNDLDAGGR